MTILERIRGIRRPAQLGRFIRDLVRRDLLAIGRDAADIIDQVKDVRVAAVEAIEQLQSRAGDAAERAGDAVGQAGEGASRAAADLRLDSRVDDLVVRLRKSLPTEHITSLVTTLERELPTTDKDRYDRAYGRGWARARTSYAVVGIAAGIAAGIAGAFLLDPEQGPRRRAALRASAKSGAARAQATAVQVGTQARRTAAVTTDRAIAMAEERGVHLPDAATALVPRLTGRTAGQASNGHDPLAAATPTSAPPPLVPVMDPSIPGDTSALATDLDEALVGASGLDATPGTASDAGTADTPDADQAG